MGEGPLFLNTPISSSENDIVGVGTYVEKLDRAIDAGAQMIAITSPFGAGKSSVIELLEKKRAEKLEDCDYRKKYGKEHFIEIPMWSHLGAEQAKSCSELHKTFVYQLANQIAPEKGTYVNRRLSRNYGLLRLYANSRIYWLFTLAAIAMVAVWWTLHTFDEKLKELLPWLAGKEDILSAILLFGAILFVIFILTRADIIFSSNKSEGERDVEEDEIIDIYRTELLRPRHIRWKFWTKWRKGTRYIVVIEDLDRTDSPKVVLQFLKELRKYYLPEKTAASYLNRVTFLINIKPESKLVNPKDAVNVEEESLYAKIFDYILTLRTINIDNYDAVLNGLLAEHRGELQTLLNFSLLEENAPSKLPGMQWIIRERRLGIREIKERLNIAFSLFEALHQKFPTGGIAFEKCAAVAYLVTAFENDFYGTDDRAYQKLVDVYLKESSESPFSEVREHYKKHLPNTSEEYQKAVWELIHAKLIDSTYRTYFYNYPQESLFYTANESVVMNAILYEEAPSRLKEVAAELAQTDSTVIETAYYKRQQLGLLLPGFVLEIEPLYVKAVQICFDDVLKRLASLDYSQEATQKNLRLFQVMLSFDAERKIVGEEHIKAICTLWEREMDEPSLLQLRRMLCEAFPREILWYRALFFGIHKIATLEELDQLAFSDAINLINQENEEFSKQEAEYLLQRFSGLEMQAQEGAAEQTEHFLRGALEKLGIEAVAEYLLSFMHVLNRIVPDFETSVGKYLEKEDAEFKEKSLFNAYQSLINQIAPQGIGKETAERISELDWYEGYSPEVAKCLLENGFSIDYVLLTLCQDQEIAYEKEEVISAIQTNEEWLFNNHPDLFGRLRLHLVRTCQQAMEKYRFLFGGERPIMTAEELNALWGQKGDIEARVISLIPASKVTEEETGYLRDFFCRRKQSLASTMNILTFVSKMDGETAAELFFNLDFSKICYRTLSEKRKMTVKTELHTVLDLEQAENKLKFMKVTQYLDPVWEENLHSTMKDDKNLQRTYVETVNGCEKLSKSTIGFITDLGTIYAMAPHVTEKVFQAKKYFWYVTSKIQWEKRFVMEEGERGELLWRTYLDIFGKSRDKSWNEVKQYMRKNEDFLYKVMKTEAYKSFDDESRMELTRILQSSASIAEVLSRGTQFALNYYLEIEGFQDKEAASTFVELVCKDPVLLASEELYEHTHDRLVNGTLKGKYTTRRKKNS